MTSLYCGRTVRSSQRRFSIKKPFLKSSQYPQKTPVLESLFKNVAGLEACSYIKKRPQHRCFSVNIVKFFILLISKNICERLLFYFFNGSLLHGPNDSRPRFYDSVRLQSLSHRSSFLFLSWNEPSPCIGPASENLRQIKFLYWFFLVVLDGFRCFLDWFRSF